MVRPIPLISLSILLLSFAGATLAEDAAGQLKCMILSGTGAEHKQTCGSDVKYCVTETKNGRTEFKNCDNGNMCIGGEGCRDVGTAVRRCCCGTDLCNPATSASSSVLLLSACAATAAVIYHIRQ